MAQKKAGGSTKNGRKPNPKYWGVKYYGGEYIKTGSIIIKQRGTNFNPGINTKKGKDHTIFSLKNGFVFYSYKKKKNIYQYSPNKT